MFNYAEATATFMKRGSLDTDHLVEAMKKKEKIVLDEINKKNQLLLEILDKNSVNLTNEEDSNMAIYILRKAVKNQLEIEFLLKIIEGLDIFQKHQDVKANCSRIILNNIKYRFYKKNECIFKIGDKGGSYFIVLKGAVHCLIPDLKNDNNDQDDDFDSNQNSPTEQNDTPSNANNLKNLKNNSDQSNQQQLSKTPGLTNFFPSASTSQLPKKHLFKKSNTMSESRTIALLRETKKRDEDQDFLEQTYPDMKLVKTYTNGGAFGEIALLTKEKRTATMVCEQDTHLMCLSKEGFDQIMGAYREFVFNERVEYLRQFSFFKNIPTPQLLSLWHYMKEDKFNTKNVIYTENDPSCFLFFIRKGEVQINKIAKEEEPQPQEYVQHPEEEVFASMNISKQRKGKKINQNKRVPLVLLGPNCYFGEEEIFQKQSVRVSQAQCMTESSILIIEKKKLFGFLRYHEQFQKFKEDVKVKSNWKEQQLQKPTYLNYQKEKLKPLKEKQNQQPFTDIVSPQSLQKSNSQIYSIQKRDSINMGQSPLIPLSQLQNNEQSSIINSTPSQSSKMNFHRTKSVCYNEINIATSSVQDLLKFKQQVELQSSPIHKNNNQTSSQKLIKEAPAVFENSNYYNINTLNNDKNSTVIQKVRKARLSNGVIFMETTPKKKFNNSPTNTFFTELMKDFNLPDLNPTIQSEEKQGSQHSVHETSILMNRNGSKKLIQSKLQTTTQSTMPSSMQHSNSNQRLLKKKSTDDMKQSSAINELPQNLFKIKKYNSQKVIRGSSSHQEIPMYSPQLHPLSLSNNLQDDLHIPLKTNENNFVYNNVGESLEYLNDNAIRKQKEFMQRIQNASSPFNLYTNGLSIDAAVMSISSKKGKSILEQSNKSQEFIPILSPKNSNDSSKDIKIKGSQSRNSIIQNNWEKNGNFSVKHVKDAFKTQNGFSGAASLVFDTNKIDLKAQQENIFTDKNKFLGLKMRKQFQFQNWKFQSQPLKYCLQSLEKVSRV